MRYADASTKENAIIIPPDQEQTTLAFKVSSASTSQNGGKKGRTKTKSNNGSPAATKAPATLHSIPLSPTRQLKRPRYPRPSSSSHPDSAFRLPKGVPVISLLSDDDSDDAAIERWLGRPPVDASARPQQVQRPSGITSSSTSPMPRVLDDSQPQIPRDETDEEGEEDVDQLSWSDEEETAVPTHVARARKNKAAKQSRQQRNDRSSSTARPMKRGRPSDSGRPAATQTQPVVSTQPSANDARLLSPPALPTPRWKHLE